MNHSPHDAASDAVAHTPAPTEKLIESCQTYELSHVTHMNGSCHTYEQVIFLHSAASDVVTNTHAHTVK